MSPVPIYKPGWRETMWGKVSCVRRQHDGRNWASNHRTSDLKSNALTATPLRPHSKVCFFFKSWGRLLMSTLLIMCRSRWIWSMILNKSLIGRMFAHARPWVLLLCSFIKQNEVYFLFLGAKGSKYINTATVGMNIDVMFFLRLAVLNSIRWREMP